MFLSGYISRNYRRLLVCVRAPPDVESGSGNTSGTSTPRRRPTSGCFSPPGDFEADYHLRRGKFILHIFILYISMLIRIYMYMYRGPVPRVRRGAKKRPARLRRLCRHGLHANITVHSLSYRARTHIYFYETAYILSACDIYIYTQNSVEDLPMDIWTYI